MIRASSCVPLAMAGFQVLDWDLDLSPWHDPAINRDPVVGSASYDTLRFVTDDLLPALFDKYGELPVILGGYSLGGLFSLWAATVCDKFPAIAAASPTLWIKDWGKYSLAHPSKANMVYLSLGDREEKTRNPVMATVGSRIREAHTLLKDRGVNCILEWNEGNHFKDADLRTARAFAWVINSNKGTKK